MTFAWQSKILIRITLGDQYHRIYYKKTIKKKKGRAGTLQLPWRSILHKINGIRRQFIAILLSIEHHPLTCKTNTKNKKKRQKLEKNTLAGRSLSYSKLSGSKRLTEKARCRQRGSTELAMSETESHEDIVKEEYTDKISSPVLLWWKGSSLV